ncbi:RNA polymerase III-inhibiting protein maf1 [Lunasporangiospora selenospora]|uniref:Repressor of RNA polymerase III transcription MAF1 n=1 Tax=Lunasporangiospora selenospora TaxID=979761 RepID=A0A9P6KCQ5_9FUNG|nr:RNA polymerase III-inhibiting protein maf1 [Lunasporangiospora selenospora]
MKFLEYAEGIDAINSALTFEAPECKVYGRVEPYSCKAAGADKKLYKQIEVKYDTSSSPPDDDDHAGATASSIRSIISPFGPMDQAASRRTLFYLIGTLNASFPDYDFSDTKPEHFRKEPSVAMVINSINATLFNHGHESIVKDLRIWESIDSLISLDDSDVYSYNPESDSDPNDEEGAGTLWSFNYFFFNRKRKRIIYFTMKGVGHGAPPEEGQEESNDDFSDMDDEMDNNNGVGRPRRGSRYEDYVAGEMDMDY